LRLRRNREHETAFWAGGAAFFGNLVGLEILDQTSMTKVLGSVGVSLCVGGTVYCKQRLDDEKAEKKAERDEAGDSPS
jgi:hypothetical protein